MKQPQVGAIGTRAILSAFETLGLDRRRLQAEAGFSDQELSDPDGLLPAEAFYRMWTAADLAWGRPALGVHTAAHVPFGAYEVLDYLLLTSGSLDEGLGHFARCFALATRTSRYQITDAQDEVAYEMVWNITPHGAMFHLRDYSLATVSGRAGYASGERPVRVELSGPALASAAEYARQFGVPVVLHAARNALVFASTAWRKPLPRHDAALNRTLRRHAHLLLQRHPVARESSVADQVRAELLDLSAVGLPSVEVVGKRLGMSGRTLQRKLRDEGASFDAVSQQVRTTLAEAYLQDARVTVTEVAYLLGFSESSAFSRAFKRWTGRSPREYRAARPHAAG